MHTRPSQKTGNEKSDPQVQAEKLLFKYNQELGKNRPEEGGDLPPHSPFPEDAMRRQVEILTGRYDQPYVFKGPEKLDTLRTEVLKEMKDNEDAFDNHIEQMKKATQEELRAIRTEAHSGKHLEEKVKKRQEIKMPPLENKTAELNQQFRDAAEKRVKEHKEKREPSRIENVMAEMIADSYKKVEEAASVDDKWEWTFQGKPPLTQEEIENDHKTASLKEEAGVKKSGHKPQVALLDIQFPNALRAIAKASQAGHEKYKETDQDYKNFQRVPNAEMQYRSASRRHELDRENEYIDTDTQLPHIVLKAWNTLAELEMHLRNKKQ